MGQRSKQIAYFVIRAPTKHMLWRDKEQMNKRLKFAISKLAKKQLSGLPWVEDEMGLRSKQIKVYIQFVKIELT